MEDQKQNVVPLKPRTEVPQRWVFISGLFHREQMGRLVRCAEDTGFGNATYANGTFRDNVKTVFYNQEEHGDHPLIREVFDRIVEKGKQCADLLEIDVYEGAKGAPYMQIARYLQGDHYGVHTDHASDLRTLDEDRKVSLFVSMTDNGALEVAGEHVRLGCGDALAFPSTMPHAAPVQEGHSRYSFVTWLLGPAWR